MRCGDRAPNLSGFCGTRFRERFLVGSAFNDLIGADSPDRPVGLTPDAPSYITCPDIEQLDSYINLMPRKSTSEYVDIVELFGGSGGVLKMLIHRGYVIFQVYRRLQTTGYLHGASMHSI